MMMHDYRSDAIFVEALQSSAKIDLLQATTKLYEHLTVLGLQHFLHIMDNECSAGMKGFIHRFGSKNQLVPPGLHRTLMDE